MAGSSKDGCYRCSDEKSKVVYFQRLVGLYSVDYYRYSAGWLTDDCCRCWDDLGWADCHRRLVAKQKVGWLRAG